MLDHINNDGGTMKVHLTLFRAIILIVLTVIISNTVLAQPDTLWTKTFGGSSGDYGKSVQQTSDGGYIITGYTGGVPDVWLIKTNEAGDALWTKTFGGSPSDYGESVQQTTDGGYIITGYTRSYGAGSHDVYLIKTDASGDTLWTKTYGGSSDDYGKSVQQTSDGGYIIIGRTESYGAGDSDVWLIKTNEAGDTLWTKTYGGGSDDYGNSVQQTSDGGYIITGYKFGVVAYDVWLIKTDTSGNVLWTKTFDESGSEMGNSVQQTSDGGYIITGSKYSTGDKDVLLIKTDSSGDRLWTKIFGGIGYDEGNSCYETTDGGYVIAGYTKSYGAGDSDVWLIKTDILGDTVWTQNFGGSDSDVGNAIQQISDGGYIITGYTKSYGAGWADVWLIRVTTSTNLISPNGGETWVGGSNNFITWTTNAQGFGSSALLLSTNGGVSYNDTVAIGISPGSFSWNWSLPPINRTTCRVRVQILDTGNNVISEDASNGNFTIQTYPTITSPNGFETWTGGSTHPITWTTVGQGFDSYRLLLSTDGGSSYPDTITTGISPDSTSWNWTLPPSNCTTCRVKVQILDVGNNVISEDESNSNLSILTYPSITYPNGGETLVGGSTFTTTWSTVGQGFDSYRLLYSTDGGSSYPDTVTTGISPDSTSYNWTLPPINYATCRVKVQILDTGNNVISEDESNSNFSILTYPSITSPNGGETLVGGSTFPITWSTVGEGFNSYRLLFSSDGGSSYPDTIATGISPDSTSLNWTLPPINCNTCRVKVQILDTGNNVISEDASDGDFAIQFYTTLISPNGSETWKGGTSYQIRWHTVGDGFLAPGANQVCDNTREVSSLIGEKSNNQWDITGSNALLRFLNAINSYRLLYSTDGGSSYPDTIASDISRKDTTYDWITPEITSDYVRIKIQVIGSENQVLAEDWSDGNFEIDATPPAAITDLHIVDRTYNTITIRWTAPGDDSLSGVPTEYDIRYALSPIEEANWGAAIQCDDEPTPSWPGGHQTFTTTNLMTDTPYHFAMKTSDNVYNWSGLSNVALNSTTTYPILASSQNPMFHYNIQHTGRSPYYGALSSNIKWYFATDQPVSSSPVISPDGIIYFTSGDNTLYAINPDGSEEWNKPLNSTKSSPAITIDSTIYIGTDNGVLIAYGYDGNIKWEYVVSGSINSSPAIGADGAIYFGSTTDTLYSVNADGSLKWKYSTGGDILSSPAISTDGIVYVGSNDHKLYAINPDGSPNWSMNTPGAIISSPAVDTSNGVIYAGSCNGKLYAVNPNGTIGWTYTTGDTITSSPAIDANGNILFGSYDGKVYALSPEGDLLWSYQTEDKIECSPVIDARGSVYIGSNDGTIYCLNGLDGSLVWSSITGDKIISSPAIAANSCVYVGSNDGRLYAYGPTAPVTLISPNGGENWDKNTVHNILWATTGSIENIELYYSLDSGNSYTLISDSEIDDGIYPWNVPDTTSSTCRVKVIAYDTGGDSDWDASDEEFSIGSEVGIEEVTSPIPSVYSLAQNYPNPFNPSTTILYQLPKSTYVKLSIYDITGRLVETLVNEHKNAGYYSVNWNADNISSGIYIYRIEAGEFSTVRKCLVVK